MTSIVHCNLPNDQLSNEEFNRIQERMYPGEYSMVGFLAPNEKLVDIIEKDRLYLESVNITYDQIADRLLVIEEKHRHNHQSKSIIENKFEVSMVQYKGIQECPFQNYNLDNKTHYEYGSADITITNLKTNKTIKFGSLMHHLIRSHHFFEGSILFRLDPKEVIEVLEIIPGVNYAPIYKYKYTWNFSASDSNIDIEIYKDEYFKMLTNYAIHTYLGNGMIVFMLPSTKYFVNIYYDVNDMEKMIETFIDCGHNKLSWIEMRKQMFIASGEKELSDDKINNIIENELKIIEQAKNGIFDNVELLIFNNGKNNSDMTIENIGFNILFNGMSTYRLNKNAYISND
jgi:hypothetical protein